MNWTTKATIQRMLASVPATLEPLLTPIDDDDFVHFEVTSAPLPTPACGAVELVIP